MNGILLDTHVWIWFINGSKELTEASKKLINTSIQTQHANLAAISLWEVSMLASKECIILDMPCLEWINKSIELTCIKIIPLTPSIAVESCNLPDTFHDDPADRMLVATARVEKLTLLTRDARILKYGHKKYVSTKKT